MRQRFESDPGLQITPIEQVRIPLKSRDELRPILAGLQWIWCQPTLKGEIFQLLEQKILAGKQATGRKGMDLWQILVLGVVRLGLDADWDRMEHLANYDSLLRQMLGVEQTPWGAEADINALEHRGLDRCLDLGVEGYTRYVGYGALAYNLHVIGRQLLARGWVAGSAAHAA